MQCENNMEIFIDNIKMPSRIYYQSNKEYYSQYQRKFYNDNKETLKEHVRIKYHNLPPKEKEKRKEHAKNRYDNLPEDKKNDKRAYSKNRYHNMFSEQLQKHKEYQKNYQKIYREKKKRELQNSKEEQGNSDKNAVLIAPKT